MYDNDRGVRLDKEASGDTRMAPAMHALHRHVVVVQFAMRYPEGRTRDVFHSAFVISIDGIWALITAGHCIEDFRRWEREGVRINGALLDYHTQSAIDGHAVPFNYHDANPYFLTSEDYGFDYGLVPLSDNTVRVLKANGITAMDESVWSGQPAQPDGYYLLGAPAVLAHRTPHRLQVGLTLLAVERLAERPHFIDKSEAPRFFGKVTLDAGTTSVEGMSGGPIFAYVKEGEKTRYWVHSIQSGAARKEYISGCFIGPFIEHIKNDKEVYARFRAGQAQRAASTRETQPRP